jgi:hypothetical protein
VPLLILHWTVAMTPCVAHDPFRKPVPAVRGHALVGSVLFGADDAVVRFVQARIRGLEIGPHRHALGVVRGGALAAGIVFHNWRRTDVEIVAAADSPAWAYPATLRTLFFYPFVTLGCVRVTAIVGRRNRRSRAFVAGLGFRLEGVIRRGLDGRQDAFVYGLLREECRFLLA